MADLGPVTCAGCGLLCDDVTIERSDGAVRLRPDCRLGDAWFSDRIRRRDGAPASIDGEQADVESAFARAVQLLRGARRPLLYGFDEATVEDARAAFALADRLGALVITQNVNGGWPGAPAVALRGSSSATLGEIRDRSELVVIWREDPERTHPRLLERLGFGDGARSRPRTLVVVDDRDTATAAHADLRLRWGPKRDLEALVTLSVLQQQMTVRPGDLEEQLSELVERVNRVPHLAFVYGAGLIGGAGGQRRALALHEMVRWLCHERHAVTLALPRAAGITAAQDALAWQTGFGGNVDLASGHPELLAVTRPLRDRENVDLSLCVEGHAALPAPGAAEIALCAVPPTGAGPDPRVWIRTAAAGVEASGTAHRLDGVPLTLQSPVAGDAPTAAALLARLLSEVEA